jgi:hypothetical protein
LIHPGNYKKDSTQKEKGERERDLKLKSRSKKERRRRRLGRHKEGQWWVSPSVCQGYHPPSSAKHI